MEKLCQIHKEKQQDKFTWKASVLDKEIQTLSYKPGSTTPHHTTIQVPSLLWASVSPKESETAV